MLRRAAVVGGVHPIAYGATPTVYEVCEDAHTLKQVGQHQDAGRYGSYERTTIVTTKNTFFERITYMVTGCPHIGGNAWKIVDSMRQMARHFI